MAYPCEECQLDGTGIIMTPVSSRILEAARKGHIDCVETFQQQEQNFHSLLNTPETAVDVNPFGIHNRSMVLMEAARTGDLDFVKNFIRSVLDENGSNSLAEAVTCGDMNIVKTFLQAGANTNKEHRASKNALVIAISNANVDMVNLLIEFGADVNLSIGYHLTPLIIAVNHSNIINAKRAWNVTGKAGRIYHKQMINMQTDPDKYDAYLAIVKSLIQAGADVNEVDAFTYFSKTAFVMLHVPRLLTEIKVPADGNTALMCAAIGGNLNMTQVLIDAGADVNKICKYKQTVCYILHPKEMRQGFDYHCDQEPK